MALLVGIDLGTSGLKAVVFDHDGRPLGKGLATSTYQEAPPGWAEQDPRTWWEGCGRAVRAALAQSGADAGDVAGIGVCGFHHCPVFLDAAGEPTRPSILTHDRRLGDSLEDLRRSGALEQIVRLSGSRVMTGHFPPIYHHVTQNDPERLAKARWLMLAKDYLRFKLTGEIGTEACDASGTHLVEMPGREWSGPLCGLLGVPREKLPAIGDSGQVCGGVTQEAARATGLRPGTPVVYGGGDSHCALLGLGVVGSGEAGLLLGTNSTLRASFDLTEAGFVPALEHSVWAQQHVVPGRYTVSASSMAGASVLSWFRELCFARPDGDEVPSTTYQELESLASSAPPGCDGLLFHPYLYGERSPFYNPEARGALLGLTYLHGRGHLVRSVLEGVALCIANCYDTLQAIAHSRGESIRVLRIAESGGARLGLWRQIIADALGCPLEVVPVEEAGCWGAALLAGVGVGLYKGQAGSGKRQVGETDLTSAARAVSRAADRVMPDPAAFAIYSEQRARFNAAYRALEPILYSDRQHAEAG